MVYNLLVAVMSHSGFCWLGVEDGVGVICVPVDGGSYRWSSCPLSVVSIQTCFCGFQPIFDICL
jgi:hypothetical protein